MSNVIVKMDSKVLDELIRDECIAFLNFLESERYSMSIRINSNKYVRTNKDGHLEYFTPEQLYDLYKSQSKEKVND